jgi:hypothetical protein
MWLPHVELSVARVAQRARLGGHRVPDGVIRRRYVSGLDHFFELFLPLADEWRFYDNSQSSGPRRVAHGEGDGDCDVIDLDAWNRARPSGEVASTPSDMETPIFAVDKQLRTAIRKELQVHKRKGNPVCEWQGGKVKWVRL